MSRNELALYAVCAMIVLALGWRALGSEPAAQPPPAKVTRPAQRGAERSGPALRVHVVGAVRRPGVYRLPGAARVEDAVSSAGGATVRADLEGLNLASKLADGQQVMVPRRGQRAAVTGGGGAAGTPLDTSGQIDLNNATTEQLDTLDGVGPATARKILEYRARHGPFKSVAELSRIPGIGPKKLAAMRPRLRV